MKSPAILIAAVCLAFGVSSAAIAQDQPGPATPLAAPETTGASEAANTPINAWECGDIREDLERIGAELQNAPKDSSGGIPAQLGEDVNQANEALFDFCTPRIDTKATLSLDGQDVLEAGAWSWNRPTGSAEAQGGPALPPRNAHRVSLSDITMYRSVDSGSSRLAELCCTGRHIVTGTLRIEGGTNSATDMTSFLEFKLKDVIVAAVSPATSATPDAAPESVTLNFSSIELTYSAETEEPRGGADTTNAEGPPPYRLPPPSQDERDSIRESVERSLQQPDQTYDAPPSLGGANPDAQRFLGPNNSFLNPLRPNSGPTRPPPGPSHSITAPTSSAPPGTTRPTGPSTSPSNPTQGATTPAG